MNEAELKKRTKVFALRVMKLVSGRSKAEFIAKLGIVIEEADESGYWMELIIEGELLPANRVEELLDESNQITAIMVASRKSSIENHQSKI